MSLLSFVWAIVFLTASENVQSYVYRSRHKSTSCSEPDDSTLYGSWVGYLQEESSQADNMYLLPALRNTILHELNKSDSEHVIKYKMSGSDVCQQGVATANITNVDGRTAELEQRSLCPWFYVLNYDLNRYPRTLYESKCSCEECVGQDSTSETKCESFYYNIRVLRRTGHCSHGVYTYAHGWQKIAVGCTCAVRSSGPQVITS